jgi:hypothetical protein
MRIDSSGRILAGLTSSNETNERLNITHPSDYVDNIITFSTQPANTVGNANVLKFRDKGGVSAQIAACGSAFGGGNDNALQFYTSTSSNNAPTLALTINESQNATFAGGVILSIDNAIHFNGAIDSDYDAIVRNSNTNTLLINSRNDVVINIDSNNDSTDADFYITKNANNASNTGTPLFRVQESGDATVAGELQVNNGKITVQAAEGNSAMLQIFSDEGDDNEDKWRLLKSSGNNDLVIQNYGSGSWATNVTFDQNEGAVFGGTVSDSKGDLRKIIKNTKASAYVAVASDAGKCIFISSGGVTINNNVFSDGEAVTIVNNSTSDQTITQGSGLTMHNAADASSGNRTLAGRGMATIWFHEAAECYISGAGLS